MNIATVSPLAVVRKALQAYVEKDRSAIESVLAPDYRFTSPLDNGLDRATYFARCWPNSRSMTGMDVVHGSESGACAWVVYEGSTNGKRFRNFELHRIRDGQIVETEVYFGWNVPHPAVRGSFIDPPES